MHPVQALPQTCCVLLPLGVIAFSLIGPQIPGTPTVRKRRQKKNRRTRNIRHAKLPSWKGPHLCYKWAITVTSTVTAYRSAFLSKQDSLSAVHATSFPPPNHSSTPNHTPGAAEANRADFWSQDGHVFTQNC